MNTTITKPDWVTPGTKVVAYTIGGTGTVWGAVVTTIRTVAPQSFTIEDDSGRFKYDAWSQTWAYTIDKGSVWSRTRHVVPFDSPEGRTEVAAERKRRNVRRAQIACIKWVQDNTPDSLTAAIEALRTVQEDQHPLRDRPLMPHVHNIAGEHRGENPPEDTP